MPYSVCQLHAAQKAMMQRVQLATLIEWHDTRTIKDTRMTVHCRSQFTEMLAIL